LTASITRLAFKSPPTFLVPLGLPARPASSLRDAVIAELPIQAKRRFVGVAAM
jgi:hypothetical protein